MGDTIILPKWSKSPTIGKLAAALCLAQAKMEPAKKNSVNPHFKSGYADFEAIVEAGAPIHDHGLALTLMPLGEDGLLTMLMHESGEYILTESSMKSRDPNNPQAVMSSNTYNKRRAYGGTLAIPTGEDDDGNAASAKKPKEPTGRSPNF